jgi:hypothetical protein
VLPLNTHVMPHASAFARALAAAEVCMCVREVCARGFAEVCMCVCARVWLEVFRVQDVSCAYVCVRVWVCQKRTDVCMCVCVRVWVCQKKS